MPGTLETLDARHTVLSKEIVTDTVRSSKRIFWTLRGVSWTGRDGSTPRDVNTAVAAARLNPPIQIFNINSDYPMRIWTRDIFNLIGPAGLQWISNAEKVKTSINGIFDENSGPRPSFSKLVICKVTGDPRVDVNSRGGMNFRSNTVVTPNPNFVNFRLVSVNTTGKVGYVSVPTTRVGRPTNISDWS